VFALPVVESTAVAVCNIVICSTGRSPFIRYAFCA